MQLDTLLFSNLSPKVSISHEILCMHAFKIDAQGSIDGLTSFYYISYPKSNIYLGRKTRFDSTPFRYLITIQSHSPPPLLSPFPCPLIRLLHPLIASSKQGIYLISATYVTLLPCINPDRLLSVSVIPTEPPPSHIDQLILEPKKE